LGEESRSTRAVGAVPQARFEKLRVMDQVAREVKRSSHIAKSMFVRGKQSTITLTARSKTPRTLIVEPRETDTADGEGLPA